MNKINLIDSHAHLMDEMYEKDVENVIQNAINNGIEKIINIGYSKETSIKAVELAEKYEFIYAVVGMHPDECNKKVDISFIKELAKNKKVVAIGEIGLDYHYEGYNKEMQKKYFIEQINLANELNLPVSIHSRDADMDMLEILKQNKIKNNFVMHCFSSSVEILKEVLKLGAYISIAGPVTFKNARSLIDVVKLVPQDKLMIETDCPYLSPEPNRGKRNEPANVKYTAEKIANLRGITVEELAKITTRNTKQFYQIGT